MREILFRGKNATDNNWVYGFFTNRYVTSNTITMPPMEISTIVIESGEHIMIDHKSIGQYTGLTDKNGVKIFEADIVKVYDVYCNETVVGVVEFCDGSFRIYDKDFTSYDRWMYCKVEVIGNIYDNPELLEG